MTTRNRKVAKVVNVVDKRQIEASHNAPLNIGRGIKGNRFASQPVTMVDGC